MPGDSVNNNAAGSNRFDAIVIGSGISGGWAAKEFCDHGFKTLVIERGRNVVHLKDYPTATLNPWDFPHHEKLPLSVTENNPIVNRCYAFNETSQHFFVKDQEHPYTQEKPFDWIRGYQVGENHCSGQDRHSGGVNTISKVPAGMDLLWNGLYLMRNWPRGIVMSSILQVSAAISMDWIPCRTEIFCRHGK